MASVARHRGSWHQRRPWHGRYLYRFQWLTDPVPVGMRFASATTEPPTEPSSEVMVRAPNISTAKISAKRRHAARHLAIGALAGLIVLASAATAEAMSRIKKSAEHYLKHQRHILELALERARTNEKAAADKKGK